jgi:hypothetical protein
VIDVILDLGQHVSQFRQKLDDARFAVADSCPELRDGLKDRPHPELRQLLRQEAQVIAQHPEHVAAHRSEIADGKLQRRIVAALRRRSDRVQCSHEP